jgi:hypothetical protein
MSDDGEILDNRHWGFPLIRSDERCGHCDRPIFPLGLQPEPPEEAPPPGQIWFPAMIPAVFAEHIQTGEQRFFHADCFALLERLSERVN